MRADELSPEDHKRIMNKVAMSFLMTFWGYLLYRFGYRMNINPQITDIEFLNVTLVWMIIGFSICSLVYEVFYHGKIRISMRLQLKRFSARTLTILSVFFLWFVFVIFTQPLFSQFAGSRYIAVSSIVFLLLFSVVVLSFRRVFVKLERGEWVISTSEMLCAGIIPLKAFDYFRDCLWVWCFGSR
jgi:hypothetical protein